MRRFLFLLSQVVLPLGITHVSRLEELLVHREGEGQVMLRLPVLCMLEIIAQHLAVLGCDTVIDDLFGTLTGTLTTQVGYSLLGHDDLDRVLAMIEVGHHRYDGGDSTVLRRGGGCEDREVGVTGEIA